MKKIIIGTVVLTMSSLMANADVVISSSGVNASTIDLSVVNNAGTPEANSAVSPNTISNDDGTAFSGGSLSTGVDGAFFTFTLDAYSGHDYTTASGAANYNTYIDGLVGNGSNVNVRGWTTGGIGSNDADDPANNGFRFDAGQGTRFELSGMTAGHTVNLSQIALGGFAGSEVADIFLYDADGDTTHFQFSDTSGDTVSLDFTMEVGDFFTVANDAGNNYHVESFTADLIPEPATLGLVVAFGGGILFIRRRMMM